MNERAVYMEHLSRHFGATCAVDGGYDRYGIALSGVCPAGILPARQTRPGRQPGRATADRQTRAW